MSPRQPTPVHRIFPLARHFRPQILLGAAGFLAATLGACTTAPSDSGPSESAARTEILRQEAAKAEAERIERLKLEGATPTGTAQPAGTGASGPPAASNRSESSQASERPKKTKLEEAKELANKIEKTVRNLYLAQLEEELAKEKAEHAVLAAQDTLTKAQVELQQAEDELIRYKRMDGPALIGKQQLSMDKLSFRLEEAQQNLDQMRDEYSKFETDSVAMRTGKIVIWRAETQLDFAKREVGLAKLADRVLTKTTIPQKTAALEATVAQKKSAVRQAEEALARLDFENKMSLTKAANNIVYQQMELDELREKQAGL